MQNTIDKVISALSPSWGLKRAENRARISLSNSMLGAFGEPTGFVTAGANHKATKGWFTRRASADEDVLPKHDDAIASSRDLSMNTPIASAILKRVATNVVGMGLTFQSRVDRKGLGLTDEAADAWEEDVERKFRVFAESKNCDVERTLNFYQLQYLAFMSPMLSGDVFFMLPWIDMPGSPFETCIRLIESDLCCNPSGLPDTTDVAGGIRVDKYGAPSHYYFASKFPVGNSLTAMTPTEWIEVPAWDVTSGRRNVHHIFNKTRPGQRRGMPFLSAIFVQLKQISRLSDAKLMQNLIQSFFTVFIKDTASTGGLAPGYADSTSVVENTDPNKEFQYEMGSANVVELDQNKDIVVADPKRMDGGFKDFFDSLVMQIGASCEIPFEQVMLHFSASYSASRAALIEAYKFYKSQRASFAMNFCQPVYEAWLHEMIIKGYITAPGFMDDPFRRAYWSKAKWSGAGMGQIDTEKETNSAIARINANLSNNEDEYAQIYGGDWDSAFQRRVREYTKIEASGVQPMASKAYDMRGENSRRASKSEKSTESEESTDE